MRKKKQLLKQLFCIALTFALLLGFVPGAPVLTARAEGTCEDGGVCVDEDNNLHCDNCWKCTPGPCSDTEADTDHCCDICGRFIEGLCTDEDGNHHCDTCNERMWELCSEGTNVDHFCDGCRHHLPDVCDDGTNEDHRCEVCNVKMSELCVDSDEDTDHLCDICSYELEYCSDLNADGKCDECGLIPFDSVNTVITFENNKDVFVWEGEPVKPAVTVTHNGASLVKGTDYTVEYVWNEWVPEDGIALVYVYGTGDYSGYMYKEFTIQKGTYTPEPASYETTCGINATTVTWELYDLIPPPKDSNWYEYTLGEITVASSAGTQPATGTFTGGEVLTATLPATKSAGDVFSFPVIVSSGNYENYTITFQVTVSAKKDRTLAWNRSLMSLWVEYGDGKVIDLSDYIVLDTSEGSDLSTVTYSAAPGSTRNPSWTLNGSILTPGNAGEVLLTATLPGDDTYNDMTSTVFLYIEPAEAEGKIVFETITGEGKMLADVSWTADFKDKDGNPLSGTLIWDDGYDNLGNIIQPDSVAVEQGVWYAYEFYPTDLNYVTVRDTVCLYPEHSWTYSAQNNILTVECTDDGCDKKVTMTLEKASYCTGVYEPEALQGVVVQRSDEEDLLLPEVYVIYEVKNAAGEYEKLNDIMVWEPIDAGSYRAGITFGGVTAYLEYEIAPKSLTDETVSVTMASTEGTYTGSSQVMPELVVKDSMQLLLGDDKLIKDTDYTITYYRMVDGVKAETEDLTNAGEIYVVVTGIGNYTGSVEKTYTVNPKEVTNPVFSGLGSKYAYTGTVVEPSFTLMDGEKEIPYGDEWSYGCDNNVNIGTATITLIDMPGGNYRVIGSATFEIAEHFHDWAYSSDPANANVLVATCQNTEIPCDVSTITFTLTAPAEEELYYDGNTKRATLTQTSYLLDGIIVKYTKDGIEVGTPNEAGTYTAYLTLGEGEAAATASVTYTIKKVELPEESRPYAAEFLTYEHGRAVEACINAYKYVSDATYSFSTSTDGVTWSDWTETMPTMTDVGTLYVKAKVTDSSRYNDFETEAALVTMQPFDLCNPTYSLVMEVSDVYYTGSEQEPEFSVYVRDKWQTDITEALKANCIITYANNIDITTEDSKAELIITGDGNYSGYIIAEFDIEQADITAVATTDTVTEAGEPNWKTEATITAPEGYTIATTPDGEYAAAMTVTESGEDETGTLVTYYLKQEETGYVSVAKTITVYVDAEASSGAVTPGGAVDSEPDPTPEVTPTVTPGVTATPMPTATPVPTAAPSATPAPTPVPGTVTVPTSGETIVDESGEEIVSIVQEPGTTSKLVIPGLMDVKPEEGEEAAPVVWESTNPDVAEVDENGNITMKEPGLAEIVVTVGEGEEAKTETIVVLVENPRTYVNPLEEAFKDVRLGTSWDDIPLIRYQKVGTTVDINFWGVKNWKLENYEYIWETSDKTVATVDNKGRVTALKPGVIELTLGLKNKATGNYLNVQSVEIVIPENYEDKILLGTSGNNTFDQLTLQLNERIDINFYGVKNWKKEDYEYRWVSSEPTVVWVDKLGRLVPVTPGKADIFLVLVEKKNGFARYVVPVTVTVPEKAEP